MGKPRTPPSWENIGYDEGPKALYMWGMRELRLRAENAIVGHFPAEEGDPI